MAAQCAAQESESSDLRLPTIAEFDPVPMLKVPVTRKPHAAHPVIDVHTHFGFRLKGDTEALRKFVEVMDRNHIAICNSLDARLGAETEHLGFLEPFRDRFTVFAHIDFQGDGGEDPRTWACNQPGFVRTTCELLRQAKANGVVGVKFFKQFGLGYRDANGQLLKIDDPRWDPIWQTCGRLGLPVLIHTADPAAFFQPITPKNERFEELYRHPEWSFYGKDYPTREALLEARNRVIARHPKTLFIGAHVANNPEDLASVQSWLDQYPNLYIEFASRIAELGRQPYSARDFVIKNQDRILFGTDGPWPEQRLEYYWRFLETRDQYFPYSEKSPPPQGLWRIYGLDLPDEVLKKIYFQNALRLIPSAEQSFQQIAENWQAESP